MKLFKYEGYEVKVAPEALTLKLFKKIWDRDKSKQKEQATMEFSFLYFYCDPRSDYQYIVDDDDRLKAVKEGVGFSNSWKPDATLNAAIDFYRSFDSSAAILLKAAARAVKKIQETLDDLSPDDTKSLKDYMAAVKLVPEVAAMIQEAEKKLNEETEFGEARGSMEKAMFDDGLDDVADWVNQNNKL